MWGWRQNPVDLVFPIVAVTVMIVGVCMLQQTSLDALARRSSLVAQLRFAVTMQDIRTVILLRRQLNQEQTRTDPWVRVPKWITRPIPRRGAGQRGPLPAASAGANDCDRGDGGRVPSDGGARHDTER